MKTGFEKLDKIINMNEPKLITIAGIQNTGKTTLLLNIIDNLLNQQKSILFFSLEIGKETVLKKLTSKNKSIYIDDSANVSIRYIKRKVRKMILEKEMLRAMKMLSEDVAESEMLLEKNINLIVIDYLQLIDCKDNNLNIQECIFKTTLELLRLAKEMNIPILITSQVSRNAKGTKTMLSDFNNSRSLLTHSDVIMILNRNGIQNDITELTVAKNNDGTIASINLKLETKTHKFEEI